MTRLLIVDDDSVQARALARAFSQLRPELSVLTANSGLDATRLMSERGVDLVLTDLQMPEMDGFELVAWILSHCPDVAIFTMSAFGTEQTASRLESLGAIEYFTKAIHCNKKYASACLARGRLYAKLGKKEEACRDFRRAESLGSVDAKIERMVSCK